ncbi:UDP-N-acetylmuramate--L-alanine ligase [Phytohabitans houttuyneae]|uniref:UDP-N-acetylmuramate--L-alanine ligase n=1 Tax=Phytohabitans houttuyneae TaxID=1076126 RepID=A0A6V8KNE1_9ACTN|nr:Mur ligase family protein [Phytohabitans houttuyneae]GFJ84900.1 UDP-N-acetylmuramate--L-alanine ligase [Phytohabitans houttuyneae]
MTSTVHHDPLHNRGPINLHRPHFVGIGEPAMAALAHICAQRGSLVTGSHHTDNPALAALRAAHCRIELVPDAIHVHTATCVVYSTAAADSLPVHSARAAGIPVVHHAQVLAALVDGRHLLAVAGTHGKSVTTGILAQALTKLGADPTYAIAADLDAPGSGGHHGTGRLMVAETDESDRSFQHLHPDLAVITGIHHDHPDTYTDLADHIDAHTAFAANIRPGGILIVNADNPATLEVAGRLREQNQPVTIASYGKADHATVRILGMRRTDRTMRVDVRRGDQEVEFALATPSIVHAHDAVAALAALAELDYPLDEAFVAVSAFTGVDRRFTELGEGGGRLVIDSYAAHPDQISADLDTADALAGNHNVLVVFQPSGERVAAFADQIAGAVTAGADKIVLLDIHGHPAPGSGVTRQTVADAISAAGGTSYHAAPGGLIDLVTTLTEPGDIVVTMGTGDVTHHAHAILNHLRQRTTLGRVGAPI